MPDFSRNFFLAPQIGAPKGYDPRHQAVYSLAQAPDEAFETFFAECLATLPAGIPVDLTGVDRARWGFTQRWWALNMVVEYGGSVATWDNVDAALAALRESNVASATLSALNAALEQAEVTP